MQLTIILLEVNEMELKRIIHWVLPFALGIIGAAVGMFILWLLLPSIEM
jgi:hypothetical protein